MQIKKYTKRPVEVEAIEVHLEDFPNIAMWCDGKISEYFNRDNMLFKCVEFKNIGGWLQTVKDGDYLVKENEQFFGVSDEMFKYNFKET